jgi:hypothetical protein
MKSSDVMVNGTAHHVIIDFRLMVTRQRSQLITKSARDWG